MKGVEGAEDQMKEKSDEAVEGAEGAMDETGKSLTGEGTEAAEAVRGEGMGAANAAANPPAGGFWSRLFGGDEASDQASE